MTEPNSSTQYETVSKQDIEDANEMTGVGYEKSGGFQSPNYTQTPNDFFAMLPEMSDAETKVTLVMIRNTFGFHRTEFKMGVSKLADAAGLSRQGALDGARAAEQRGTFKRTNPDAQGEAEWELILDEPLKPNDTPLKPVEGKPQRSRGQVRSKERIKKGKKKIKEVAQAPKPLKANQIPQVILFREVTKRYPAKGSQFTVITSVDLAGDRLGKEVSAEDLEPFYREWCDRGYNPMAVKWLEWAVSGNIPTNGKKPTTEPKGFEGVRKFAESHGLDG